jgi:hypothetical protein
VLRTLDMVDLAVFGPTGRKQIRDLAVAVTTPLGLSQPEIDSLVVHAMQRIAENFGFTGAPPGLRSPGTSDSRNLRTPQRRGRLGLRPKVGVHEPPARWELAARDQRHDHAVFQRAQYGHPEVGRSRLIRTPPWSAR